MSTEMVFYRIAKKALAKKKARDRKARAIDALLPGTPANPKSGHRRNNRRGKNHTGLMKRRFSL